MNSKDFLIEQPSRSYFPGCNFIDEHLFSKLNDTCFPTDDKQTYG